MSAEEKKFYPFSDTSVPDEYDGFLLLNKEQKFKFTDSKKSEVEMSNMHFKVSKTPEENSEGVFKCTITNFQNLKHEIELCHLFTIIDKDEEIVGDWKNKCPTSLDSLIPFSLKNRSLKDKKYQDSFPKIFLVAVKWKNTNSFSQSEEKVIRAVNLWFSEAEKDNNHIFSYNPEGHGVFCDKNLLNLKS